MALLEQVQKIKKEALESLDSTSGEKALGEWEIRYLGRKSEFNGLLKSLKDLPDAEKRKAGPALQAAKAALVQALESAREKASESAIDWEKEAIDITAPGIRESAGHLHPITLVENRIWEIFQGLGFAVADGPELESEHYNFDTLNFPKDHPSRDMQDTFWIKKEEKEKERYVLRTHTSNVQVRYMEAHKPPIRIIIPGRFYRHEATDASHEHTAHQFECLMVDKAVNVAHFKYIAQTFFENFFEKKIEIRLRPSFFPFTEPSFEFDISCILCEQKGCSVCKQSGWLEIGGAGMVNQKVFEAAGYTRGAYQGFAWGFGLTRLAMMKYRIPEIRLFLSGDLRFTKQFSL